MKIKITNYFLIAFCGLIIVFVPFINFSNGMERIIPQTNSQMIINIWNVEDFEGGVGSRTEWLNKRGVEFEKSNRNIFINVSSRTEEEFLTSLNAGYVPDMVSFPRGIGQKVYPFLREYVGENNVREDVKACGESGDKTYAVPYSMGGYGVFAYSDYVEKAKQSNKNLKDVLFDCSISVKHNKQDVQIPSLMVGFSKYNNPLQALISNTSSKITNEKNLSCDFLKTQYQTYESFLTGFGASILLGTQRDAYRIEARLQSGKIKPISFEAFGGYTDLVQCLGITSVSTSKKYDFALRFIEFVLSDKSQGKLIDVGLFNVVGQQYYTTGFYSQMENALLNKLIVPNIFLQNEEIEQQRKNSLQKLY